jgi:Domain of unknown function (DUF4388)
MALEGSLKDFDLADILQLIQQQKKTGMLVMKNLEREARVLFENGMVVSSDDSGPGGIHSIGEALLRGGKVSKDKLEQINRSNQIINPNIGIALVETGALAKEELHKFLDRRMKESVLNLFNWKEGQYRFEPGDVTYEREYTTPLNTEFLIIEGMRRLDEWPSIENKISSRSMVFGKRDESAIKPEAYSTGEDSGDPVVMGGGDTNGLRITLEEMAVYDLVDGRRDVRRIIDEANLGEFETCKALGNLMTAGLIRVEKTQAAPPVPEEITPTGESTSVAEIYSEEMTPSRETATEEIPSLEFTPVEKPILAREEKPSILAGLAGQSPRLWISMAIMAVLLTVMGLGVKRFEQHLVQTYEAITFFQGLAENNRMHAMRFSILSYYYAKNHLPASLDALVQEGYLPGEVVSDLKARGVRYLPDDETGEFILSIQK